jgi:hypothetical protein
MAPLIIKAHYFNNVLIPHPNGNVEAHVTYQLTEDGKMALISFAGQNRAVVHFSSTGSKVISYTSLGMDDSIEMQQSVDNIVAVLN